MKLNRKTQENKTVNETKARKMHNSYKRKNNTTVLNADHYGAWGRSEEGNKRV